MARITNIHSHIFSARCAPDYFLRVALKPGMRWAAPGLKNILQYDFVRKYITKLVKLFGHGHSPFARYLQFVDMGTQQSQEDVFNRMRESYSMLDREMRFIALTLNMDHMDVLPSTHARIEDQLAEMENVRTHFPDTIFPFVCVDPRHKGGEELVEWVKKKLERRMFFGIKLYPALGFFPFDPRLDALYAWASQPHVQVPIMTHCTRGGNYYTGAMQNVLPTNDPDTLNPDSSSMEHIRARVKLFRASPFTMNEGKYGCNIFLHPQNYVPVLEKYPQLKICFAHFGGANEMMGEVAEVVKRKLDDPPDWHTRIKDLVARYPHVFADVSYTLYEKKTFDAITKFIDGPQGHRLLFGTDFFMTLMEKPETELWQGLVEGITLPRFRKIAGPNTEDYLRSMFFDPAKRFV